LWWLPAVVVASGGEAPAPALFDVSGAGHHETLVTARRDGRRGPRICGGPTSSPPPPYRFVRGAGRRCDSGGNPGSEICCRAVRAIAARTRAMRLQPGLATPVRTVSPRSSRQLSGSPQGPGRPTECTPVVIHSQARKPQDVVVSCPPQPPYLGRARFGTRRTGRHVDRLRIPGGRPVDGIAQAVHVTRHRALTAALRSVAPLEV